MDTHGKHLLQNVKRWSDVQASILPRPGTIAVDLDAFAYGDGAILMPSHSPVGLGGLVKHDSADRLGVRPERFGDGTPDRAIGAEDVVESISRLQASARASGDRTVGQIAEAFEVDRGQDARPIRRAVAVQIEVMAGDR